jgi:hypothetical protein
MSYVKSRRLQAKNRHRLAYDFRLETCDLRLNYATTSVLAPLKQSAAAPASPASAL